MTHLGDRITALVDDRLSPGELDRVMAHVRYCSDCRYQVEREHWIRESLHGLPGAEPSAALLMTLQDIGAGTAVPISADPAVHWSLPDRRRAGMAILGLSSVAAGVLGLAYVVGAPSAEPVRPPVQQFSVEFADSTDLGPSSDPAADAMPILDVDDRR
jgi:anti-sigma factor RsiW